MSNMPTIERKSLVARFDENNIVSVTHDPDNETLLITYLEDGVKKYCSIDYNGDYKLPLMTLTVVNNKSSAFTITSLSTIAAYGIQRSASQTAAGTTEEFTSIYNSKEDGRYFVNITPFTGTFSDFVNCKVMAGTSNNLEILDPSIDASCTLTIPA